MLRRPSFVDFGICAAVTGALLVGCRQDEQITQYNIPKAEAIQLPAPSGQAPRDSSSGEPQRMLGAILPGGDQVWFFKLTGAVDPVAARWEEFQELIKSVSFQQNGEPTWTTPADWTRQPGTDLRFATLTIPGEPLLEISVSALPTGGDNTEQLLANVNRWRGQLSLPPITAAALPQETETLTTTAGGVATLVNLVGTGKAGGMMSGPFARGGMPTAPPVSPAPTGPVRYETPEGWSVIPVSGLRKAALEVRSADGKAEITVIDLSREAGERLANVNRWRGQVGLPPQSSEELKSALKSLPVGDLSGDYVELINQEGDAAQSILGVIVDRGSKTWFVKLQGPTPLAIAQREKFAEFVKSLEIE